MVQRSFDCIREVYIITGHWKWGMVQRSLDYIREVYNNRSLEVGHGSKVVGLV